MFYIKKRNNLIINYKLPATKFVYLSLNVTNYIDFISLQYYYLYIKITFINYFLLYWIAL